MGNRSRLLLGIGGLLLVLYVGSYVWLSRRGHAEADEYGFTGFYYVFPEDTGTWRLKNGACAVTFWPLNVVDRVIGSGRSPASDPLWRLDVGLLRNVPVPERLTCG